VLRALRDEGPSASELEKAKARHHFGLDVMLDDPEQVAAFLAEGVLRDAPLTPAEWRRRIDAETRGSVRRAAERLLQARNLNAVSVGFQSKRGAAKLERVVHAFV
jgi:predicted Zn-dependent peptidase